MKKSLIIAFALTLSFSGFAKSEKRGVSENNFSMGSMLEALEQGVTWYYNWGNTPGKGFENQVIDFEGIEFVPMCWNANYSAENIRQYCKAHPATKYLLGFNEPNFTQQANMTPQKAAEEWPAVKALADELGLKLVAPALNYSPNPPYTDPLKWMDEFVALVGTDAFDYTAVHCYGGLGVMQTLATNFHERYGKPVWVTEFCYWPNEGDSNSTVAPETQINSMTETLRWLESTPWIFRYAWFKALGNSNSSKGPNYGLLAHEGSSDEPWYLTPQGSVYVGLGTFDAEKWHPVGENVAAADCVDYALAGFGATADGKNHSVAELNRFSSGASIDWQFDIPLPGDYFITANVSGFGEPSRFNPTLKWVKVEGDAESDLTQSAVITLPNSDTAYEPRVWTVTLPAGKQRLRLKDMAPYQPSGIRISTVRLDDVAAVETLSDDAPRAHGIYNLQGVKISDSDDVVGLPYGIYIIGGKKVVL